MLCHPHTHSLQALEGGCCVLILDHVFASMALEKPQVGSSCAQTAPDGESAEAPSGWFARIAERAALWLARRVRVRVSRCHVMLAAEGVVAGVTLDELCLDDDPESACASERVHAEAQAASGPAPSCDADLVLGVHIRHAAAYIRRGSPPGSLATAGCSDWSQKEWDAAMLPAIERQDASVRAALVLIPASASIGLRLWLGEQPLSGYRVDAALAVDDTISVAVRRGTMALVFSLLAQLAEALPDPDPPSAPTSPHPATANATPVHAVAAAGSTTGAVAGGAATMVNPPPLLQATLRIGGADRSGGFEVALLPEPPSPDLPAQERLLSLTLGSIAGEASLSMRDGGGLRLSAVVPQCVRLAVSKQGGLVRSFADGGRAPVGHPPIDPATILPVTPQAPQSPETPQASANDDSTHIEPPSEAPSEAQAHLELWVRRTEVVIDLAEDAMHLSVQIHSLGLDCCMPPNHETDGAAVARRVPILVVEGPRSCVSAAEHAVDDGHGHQHVNEQLCGGPLGAIQVQMQMVAAGASPLPASATAMMEIEVGLGTLALHASPSMAAQLCDLAGLCLSALDALDMPENLTAPPPTPLPPLTLRLHAPLLEVHMDLLLMDGEPSPSPPPPTPPPRAPAALGGGAPSPHTVPSGSEVALCRLDLCAISMQLHLGHAEALELGLQMGDLRLCERAPSVRQSAVSAVAASASASPAASAVDEPCMLWRLSSLELTDVSRMEDSLNGQPMATAAAARASLLAVAAALTAAQHKASLLQFSMKMQQPATADALMESIGKVALTIEPLGIVVRPETVAQALRVLQPLTVALEAITLALSPSLQEERVVDEMFTAAHAAEHAGRASDGAGGCSSCCGDANGVGAYGERSGAACAAQAQQTAIEPIICLDIMVRGLLVVLPTAPIGSKAKLGAAILHIGEVHLTTTATEEAATWEDDDTGEGVGRATPPSASVHPGVCLVERLTFEVNKTRAFVSHSFDVDAARTPGWLLRASPRSLTAAAFGLHSFVQTFHRATAAERCAAVAPTEAMVIVHLRVSPIAFTLRITGLPLVLELLEGINFALAPLEAAALAQAAGPAAEPLTPYVAPLAGRRLCVHASAEVSTINGAHNGELRLTVHDGSLPLVEFALSELELSALLQLAQPSVLGCEVEEPLRGGHADVKARLHCVSLNEANHQWEPVLAPWRFEVAWHCVEALSDEPDAMDDDLAAASVSHQIEMSSVEPLELDVTHALLVSLLRSLAVVVRAEDTVVASATGRQTCALRNHTELPLTVLSSGHFNEPLQHFKTPRHVEAGHTYAFAPPVSQFVPASGAAAQHAVAAAGTLNCPELVAAARASDVEMVRALLRRGAPIDSIDAKGRGAVHLAIRKRAIPMLQLLLAAHANAELPNRIGEQRPLHVAARCNSSEAASALLEAGANPLATNAKGQVPAALARAHSPTQTKLYVAMQTEIRMAERSDESERSSSRDARGEARFSSVRLVRAAASARADQIRSLLESKADPNSFDGSLTALQACAESASGDALKAAEALLTDGAAPDLAFMAVGHGRSPLARAARHARLPLVEMLLRSGASPCQIDADGLLPIDLCTAKTPGRLLETIEGDAEKLARLKRKQKTHEMLKRATLASVVRAGWLDLTASADGRTARARYVLLLPNGWLVCYKNTKIQKPCERVLITGKALAVVTFPHDPRLLRVDVINYGSLLLRAVDAPTCNAWMEDLESAIRAEVSQLQTAMPGFSRRIRAKNAKRGFAKRRLHDSSAELTDKSKPKSSAVELRISIGSEGSPVSFEPFILPMHLGTSLVMLSHRGEARSEGDVGGAVNRSCIGVVAHIAADRGVRTLTLSSPLAVHNQCMESVELLVRRREGMHSGGWTSGEGDLAPGAVFELPLNLLLRCGGVQEAYRCIQLRPGAGYAWSLIEWLDGGTGGDAATADEHLTTKQALVACEPADADGDSWYCCARVTARDVMVSGSGRWRTQAPAGERGASQFLPRSTLAQILASESLVRELGDPTDEWHCTVREPSSLRRGAYAWLVATSSSCLIVQQTALGGIGLSYSGAWHEIQIVPQTSDTFMLTIRDAPLSIGGLTNCAHVYSKLLGLHTAYMADWAAGPSRWMPLSMELRAPLTFTNHLPCAVTLTMRMRRHAERESLHVKRAHTWMPKARPSTSSQRTPRSPRSARSLTESLWRQVVDGAAPKWASKASSISTESLESLRRAHSKTAASVTMTLAPGETATCTQMHAIDPLSIDISVAGHRAQSGRQLGDSHGEMVLDRAELAEEDRSASLTIDVQLRRDSGSQGRGAPQAHSTLQTMSVRVEASFGELGEAVLSFACRHIFQNLSSRSVQVYPYQRINLGASTPVAQAEAGEKTSFPFSLHGDAGKAQICIFRPKTRRLNVQHTMGRLKLNLFSKSGSFRMNNGVWESSSADSLAAHSKRKRLRQAALSVKSAMRKVARKQPKEQRASIASNAGPLSSAFSMVDVGTDRILQLVGPDNTVHDVIVSIGVHGNEPATAGTTVATVHDWLQLRNWTGVEMQWRTLPDGEPQPLPAGQTKPLWWPSVLAGATRLVAIRARMIPAAGQSSHGASGAVWSNWCAPIDAAEATSSELKLRDGHTGRELPRLHLHVSSQRGETRVLSVSAVSDRTPRLYCVVNDSPYLMAYRQVGCSTWDLLGAREARSFAWDNPSGTRLIELVARDASDAMRGDATARIQKVTARDQRMALSPRTAIQPALIGALPEAQQAKLSLACVLRFGNDDGSVAVGWLCVSASHVHFITMREMSKEKSSVASINAEDASPAGSSMAATASMNGTWLPLSELPLSLSTLAQIALRKPLDSRVSRRLSSPGPTVPTTAWDGSGSLLDIEPAVVLKFKRPSATGVEPGVGDGLQLELHNLLDAAAAVQRIQDVQAEYREQRHTLTRGKMASFSSLGGDVLALTPTTTATPVEDRVRGKGRGSLASARAAAATALTPSKPPVASGERPRNMMAALDVMNAARAAAVAAAGVAMDVTVAAVDVTASAALAAASAAQEAAQRVALSPIALSEELQQRIAGTKGGVQPGDRSRLFIGTTSRGPLRLLTISETKVTQVRRRTRLPTHVPAGLRTRQADRKAVANAARGSSPRSSVDERQSRGRSSSEDENALRERSLGYSESAHTPKVRTPTAKRARTPATADPSAATAASTPATRSSSEAHMDTEGSIGREVDVEASSGGEALPPVRCSLKIPRVVLTLVDAEPVEVLCVTARDLTLGCSIDRHAVTDEEELSFDVCLRRLQIDSGLAEARFKVLLVSHSALGDEEEDVDDGSPPFLELSVERLRRWAHLFCCSRFSAKLQPLMLQLEQNTTARLLRLIQSLLPALDELDEASKLAAEQVSTAQGEGAYAAAVDDAANELFIQEAALGDVRLNLTIQMDALCQPASLQPFHPTQQLLGVRSRGFMRVQGWQILLPTLRLAEAFETADTLTNRVILHYLAPLLRASYGLLASLDALNNPAALYDDMVNGVRMFVTHSGQGLAAGAAGNPLSAASGLARGTAGLARGWIGGPTAYAFEVVAKVCGSLEKVGLSLTEPARGHHYRGLANAAVPPPATTYEGVKMGAKAMRHGIVRGVNAAYRHPVRGAASGTPTGLIKGCGRGVLGLVVSPLTGVMSATSKATEGLASDLRSVTPGGIERKARERMLRERQPRVLGPGAILLPYPRTSWEVAEQLHGKDGLHGREPTAPDGVKILTAMKTMKTMKTWAARHSESRVKIADAHDDEEEFTPMR